MEYNKYNLKLSKAQHTIKWKKTSDFKINEKVFLKSNINLILNVCDLDESDVTVTWLDKENKRQYTKFPPECILQYKYAGLITYQNRFKISLN